MQLVSELKALPNVTMHETGSRVSKVFDPAFPVTGMRRIVVSWIDEIALKALAVIYGTMQPTTDGLFIYHEEGYEPVLITYPVVAGHANAFASITDDLKQRLCTATAIAIDLRTGRALDPHGGIQDIKNKILRPVNNNIFIEDPLNILPFVELATSTAYTIPKAVRRSIYFSAPNLLKMPNLDIGERLRRIMLSDNPKKILEMCDKLAVLQYILPRLHQNKTVIQTRKVGVCNVMEHSLLCLAAVGAHNELVRWAALYHDLGKYVTKREIDGKTRFFGHEKISAEWAYKDLVDWGFSRDFARDVSHLVEHHMFDGGPQLTDDAVRRLIKRVGRKHIFNLLLLRLADSAGFVGKPTGIWKVTKLRQRVEDELSKNPFSVTGLDIDMATVKAITKLDDECVTIVLDLLLDMVLFHGVQNTQKDLVAWLMAVNFDKLKQFCPLGLSWFLKQQVSRIESNADENADGTLKCGSNCGYLCDNTENLWQL